MFLLGYDIGGTKIEAALIGVGEEAGGGAGVKSGASTASSDARATFEYQDAHGRTLPATVLARMRVPTERHLGYARLVEKIAQLAHDVCGTAQVSLPSVSSIGMGVPGAVSPLSGRMLNGNTMMLIGKDLRGDLMRALDFKGAIAAENDANCFALAEALCGAGLTHAKSAQLKTSQLTGIGIILGTGCGGGIVIQGRTVRGRRGGAGELGHTTLVPKGHACYCGRDGCAEQYLSGPGLEAAFLQRQYSQVQKFCSAREIFSMYEALDPVAVAVVKRYRRDLGQFLGNLVSVFDPDFFVLGGGISNQDVVYEGLSEEIARSTFLPDSRVPVYKNELGDSAGVVGAALIALRPEGAEAV